MTMRSLQTRTVRRSLLGASQLSSTLAMIPDANRRLTNATSATPLTIESRPTARIEVGSSLSQ